MPLYSKLEFGLMKLKAKPKADSTLFECQPSHTHTQVQVQFQAKYFATQAP